MTFVKSLAIRSKQIHLMKRDENGNLTVRMACGRKDWGKLHSTSLPQVTTCEKCKKSWYFKLVTEKTHAR